MLKPSVPTTTLNKASGGAVTASQNSPFNTGNYATVVAYLKVSAASGTTPTLDAKIQDQDAAGNWYDVPNGAFTQVTTGNSTQRLVVPNVGPKARIVQTLGGTSPSFNYDLSVGGIG